MFLFLVFFFKKIGKTKGSKNASHGILAQSVGEENAMLVDEENLKALESYIGTKEMSKSLLPKCLLVLGGSCSLTL